MKTKVEDIYTYLKELQKIEVVFKDEKNIPHCLKSYIKSLDDNRILIDPPVYRGKGYNLPLGQQIKLVVYTKKGLFTGDSDVISKEIGILSGLWVSYPFNSSHYQRREYLRVPLILNSRVSILKNDNSLEVLTVPTKDISAKGCCIVTDKPLNEYKSITLKIKLENESHTEINVDCDHIYSKMSSSKSEKQYIHAFLFTNITEKEAGQIVRECFKYQLRQRKKN